MKYASKPLQSFIQDFKLSNPAGADCFNATIDFIVGGVNVKIQSEVHIVTSYPCKSGIVYLLNKDIRMAELPTMFEADKESFEYIPNKNLRIEGVHHAAGKVYRIYKPRK